MSSAPSTAPAPLQSTSATDTEEQWSSLLGRAATLDLVAEVELFQKLRTVITRQVRQTIRTQEFALEDAVANALANVFLNLPAYRPEGSFLAWVRLIARNAALDVLSGAGLYDRRLEEKQTRLAEKLEQGEAILPAAPKPNELISIETTAEEVSDPEVPRLDPIAKVTVKEWLRRRYTTTDGLQFDWALLARIYGILQTFTEGTQEVVRMRLNGHSHDDIAQELGISSVNSRVRYNRALETVRERLGIKDVEVTRQMIAKLAVDEL